MLRRALPIAILVLTITCLSLPVSAAQQGAADAANEPATPIEHFVTVMQSNRTFDNYFGTYPGADGIPDGTCMPVDPLDRSSTDCVAPYHLESLEESLSQTYRTFQNQYRGGAMDGFISDSRQRGEPDNVSMGWLDDREVPFYWNVADNYVLFDRYFSSAAAGSTPNRMYWVSGTAGVDDLDQVGVPIEGWGDDIPTIFDRLQAQGVSWKFYIENYQPEITYQNPGEENISAQISWAPVLSFERFVENHELAGHIVDLDQYYLDLEKGTLPAVSYIVTRGSSEHPPGDPINGQGLIREMVTALMQSTAWESSAFMVSYDDWGGWYDHVPPPSVDEFGYGFRVPAMLISPYAKQGYVDSTVLDHTSILKFIEDNWGIAPLDERDANANNILGAFDFNQVAREPAIISMSRTPMAVPVVPDRGVIYVVYISGTLFAILAIFLAVVLPERARRPARSRLRSLREGTT
jgi:phospholipase C